MSVQANYDDVHNQLTGYGLVLDDILAVGTSKPVPDFEVDLDFDIGIDLDLDLDEMNEDAMDWIRQRTLEDEGSGGE